MLNKNERTMETYMEAGAWARLLTEVGAKAVVSLSMVLPARESDKLVRLLNSFDEIKCKADEQLFTDFPDLHHEGTKVFYGNLGDEPASELDEEVIRTAKAHAIKLFEKRDFPSSSDGGSNTAPTA